MRNQDRITFPAGGHPRDVTFAEISQPPAPNAAPLLLQLDHDSAARLDVENLRVHRLNRCSAAFGWAVARLVRRVAHQKSFGESVASRAFRSVRLAASDEFCRHGRCRATTPNLMVHSCVEIGSEETATSESTTSATVRFGIFEADTFDVHVEFLQELFNLVVNGGRLVDDQYSFWHDKYVGAR
jgi:hypothetical protein